MIKDQENKTTVAEIIRREIELEDDMLGLYSGFLKKEEFMAKLDENDRELAAGILTILLADTARHKKTMEEIIKNI